MQLKGQLEPEEQRPPVPDDQGGASLRRLQVLLGKHLSRSAPLRASVLQPAARVCAGREAVAKVQSAQANVDRVYRRFVRRTSTQALRQALRQLRRTEAKYLSGAVDDEPETAAAAGGGDDDEGSSSSASLAASFVPSAPAASARQPGGGADLSATAAAAGPLTLVDLEHVRQDPTSMPGWPRADLATRLGLPDASALLPPTAPLLL